jgi:hypothetical protein
LVYEKIENQLESDEQVLWKSHKVINKLAEYRIIVLVLSIFILILLSIPIALFINLFSLVIWTFEDIVYSIVLWILLLLLFLLYKRWFYEKYKRALTLFGIDSKDLKEFNEICVFTTKRWIQRSLYFARFDAFEEIREYIQFENGFASIQLKNISVIYIVPNKKYTKYYVNFFIDWDDWSEEAEFTIDINKENYSELMKNIKKIFKINRIEHDFIGYRDLVYHVEQRE